MSQVTVKWCCSADLQDKPEAIAVYGDEPVAVVPLLALREVVEGLRKQATNDQFDTGLEAQAYHLALSDLLASLGERKEMGHE